MIRFRFNLDLLASTVSLQVEVGGAQISDT